jgi:uncharacterized membrane protein YdjX (TVP38/TMEM64 family)
MTGALALSRQSPTTVAMNVKRLILVAVIVVAIAAAIHFDVASQLTLANLKAQQATLAAQLAADPLPIIATFFAAYVLVTALSIPGASIMTVAAGALFGFVTGTIIVSFASTIGATIAFLSSRYLFRDWVQARFGARLGPVNDGIARDGAFYLLTLRLIPAIPFFIVNLVMGLTPIKVRTFAWVSQVGMLLATMVFVNAGTQLANIDTLSDIASPMLIASLVALAAVPWVARWLLRTVQARRG